ncbi:hypothetical protein LZC95_33190 [Pendulispora brunnea]|uniref:Uncharacterized protein n=1 Tax=Pendulispora brunnea TaxID=2905690 RepID=A0ABZ2K3D8_9BACT
MIWELGRAQGWVEARSYDILCVLETRGIPIPPEVRQRVLECKELRRLEIWLKRAVTANSAADVVDRWTDLTDSLRALLAR